MGLFSRGNQDDNDFLDEVDLPSSKDLDESILSSSDEKLEFAPAPPQKPRPSLASKISGSYGIEHAIKLMRSLPRDNNEVVVTVVKKTLESTSIQVPDIIDDANAKEDRIRTEHKTLETEIKDLQEQIAQRNQQISDLLKDLKETTDVRQRLQLALDLDRKNSPQPNAEPAPAQAATIPAAEHPAQQGDANIGGGEQSAGPQQNTTNQGTQSAVPGDIGDANPATYSNGSARRRAGHRANPQG